MITVVPIVEGDGEVSAVPVLLRRLRDALTSDQAIIVAPPLRVHRDRFLNRDAEFRRMVLLAAGKAGSRGWVLILLDADDDCPAEAAAQIRARAATIAPHRLISVVLANREFEAWFLASASTLNGRRGLSVLEEEIPPEPDTVRGAKEWISRRIKDGRYRETTDQPAFSALIDIDLAHARSRSFRKLCDDWTRCTGVASAVDS
jgi:hypothetical protein